MPQAAAKLRSASWRRVLDGTRVDATHPETSPSIEWHHLEYIYC